MIILRWLAFLPLGIIAIKITQSLTGFLAEVAPWWISVPLVLVFGMVLTIATILPVTMTPNPKIGGAILLTVFPLFEIISLLSHFGEMTSAELVVRILTDIYLCIGAKTATSSGSEKTAMALGINQPMAGMLDGVAFDLMQAHSEHRDSDRTVEAIVDACNDRDDLRYLMKAIDRVLESHYNSPYRARAVLVTAWQQQSEILLR